MDTWSCAEPKSKFNSKMLWAIFVLFTVQLAQICWQISNNVTFRFGLQSWNWLCACTRTHRELFLQGVCWLTHTPHWAHNVHIQRKKRQKKKMCKQRRAFLLLCVNDIRDQRPFSSAIDVHWPSLSSDRWEAALPAKLDASLLCCTLLLSRN